MDDKQRIPYIVFESSQARMERVNKKLWIIVLVLIVALLGTNAGWIYYESQFEEVVTNTETVTQEATADGSGEIRLIGGDYYGESKADDNQNDNQD